MTNIIILDGEDTRLEPSKKSEIGDEIADRLRRLGYSVSKQDSKKLSCSTAMNSEGEVRTFVLEN